MYVLFCAFYLCVLWFIFMFTDSEDLAIVKMAGGNFL